MNESKNQETIPILYERYLNRLKTFNVYQWFAKPIEFSPIECARHGWINIAKDTLKCVACSNIIYINFDTEKKIKEPIILTEKHYHNCPWKIILVPDKITNVELYDESIGYKQFMDSKMSLKKCEELPMLPSYIYKEYEKFELDISENYGFKFQPCENKTLRYLAYTGWNYRSKNDVVECSKCLRSAGLWLFKRLHIEYHLENLTDESIVLNEIINRIEKEDSNLELSVPKENYPYSHKLHNSTESNQNQKLFDPFKEHYSWCPWRLEDVFKKYFVLVIKHYYKSSKFKSLQGFYEPNKASIDFTNGKFHTKSQIPNENLMESSQILMERVKNAQSLLINCASKFSLK